MKKPENRQPEEYRGDFKTPVKPSQEILLPEAHRKDQPINRAETSPIQTLAEEIDKTIASAASTESSDQTADEVYDTLEELFFQSGLSQQQIFEAICEKMDEAERMGNHQKIEIIWNTSLEYMHELINQVFDSAGKKEKINYHWLMNSLQFCWQKVLSRTSKFYLIEKMRALIKQKEDPETQKRLFKTFVVSIINTLEENDPLIEIPDEMRKNFPRAYISRENSPGEEYPKQISPSILLPIDPYDYDSEHAEIYRDLSSSDSEIAKVMLELLEQDFFTDEEKWEKISCTSPKNFIQFCEQLPHTITKQIGSETSGTETLTEEMAQTIKKVWNKIIFPKLLVWRGIIDSKLLLPKEKE